MMIAVKHPEGTGAFYMHQKGDGERLRHLCPHQAKKVVG